MGQYIIRRVLIAIPTLLFISFAIFAILELSPADPVGNLPLTIPEEVRAQIRESLGVNDPLPIKYVKWLRQFFIVEPLNLLEGLTGINLEPPLPLTAENLVGPGDAGFDELLAAVSGEVEITGRSVLVDNQAQELFRGGKRFFIIGNGGGERTRFLDDVANSNVARGIANDSRVATAGELLPVTEARLRILSWLTRSPVIDLVIQRFPQTLWVVGLSYLLAIVIAVPIGVIQAYRQYSVFDQIMTVFATVGFSVPTFFTGLMFIIIFSVQFKWFPSIYDTTHEVVDFESFVKQLQQIIMPVLVLGLFYMAQISRFTRSAMLDNLNQDYVRTARAKGLNERIVIAVHTLRNSLIPVVTLIALGIPSIFQGATITEQIFRVNGLGQLLILAIQQGDLPTVQTLTFIFAVLIVFFNIVADLLYAILDPRIRYT